MPRVEIEVMEIDVTGITGDTPVVADATNDHFLTGAADGRTVLVVTSTDASDRIVEVVPSPTLVLPDGLTVNNLSITCYAGDVTYAGPFRAQTYKQDADGTLWINPAVSTTLEFQAFRLPLPS